MYDFDEIGLKLIGEIDLSYPDYSFDILAIWQNDKGYYIGTDSGCSCPTPFENYGSIEDFTGPLTAAQTIEEATSLWIEAGRYEPYDFEILMNSIV